MSEPEETVVSIDDYQTEPDTMYGSNLIHGCMVEVMRNLGAITKDQTNKFDGYDFRGIDDVYNALHPALLAAGVYAVPEVLEMERSTYNAASGKPQQLITMRCMYTFFAKDGSCTSCVVSGEGSDRGDKAINKAMSSCYKNAMIQTFCPPTVGGSNDSEDDSPELGAPDVSVRPKAKAGKPPEEHAPAKAHGVVDPDLDPDAIFTFFETFVEDCGDFVKLGAIHQANSVLLQAKEKHDPALHERIMKLFKDKKQSLIEQNEQKDKGEF